jgi:hypothetical protein
VIRWQIPAHDGRPPLNAYWYDGSRLKLDAAAGSARGRIWTPNYPPMLLEFEKKYDCDFREGWDGGTFYIGTRGIMHTGCYGQRPRILPEETHAAFPVPERRLPRIKGSHFTHFFECCKAGKPTCADFVYGAAITEFLLLGHLAIQAGPDARVEWNSQKMRCTNLPELNHHLGRKYRKGWKA